MDLVCVCHVQGRMPSDLVRALKNAFLVDPMAAYNPQLGPQDFDWAGLGAGVSGLHRTAPGVSCLLGPLEAEVSFVWFCGRKHHHLYLWCAVV